MACVEPSSRVSSSLKQVTEPHVNLRVPARVYDVEGCAIFAKNSTFVFFDGFAWTPRLRSPSPIMAPDLRLYLRAYWSATCESLEDFLLILASIFQDSISHYDDKNVKGLKYAYVNDSFKPSDITWREIPYENLKLLNELGSGAFGVVYKGEIIRDDGDVTSCAVKALKGKRYVFSVF